MAERSVASPKAAFRHGPSRLASELVSRRRPRCRLVLIVRSGDVSFARAVPRSVTLSAIRRRQYLPAITPLASDSTCVKATALATRTMSRASTRAPRAPINRPDARDHDSVPIDVRRGILGFVSNIPERDRLISEDSITREDPATHFLRGELHVHRRQANRCYDDLLRDVLRLAGLPNCRAGSIVMAGEACWEALERLRDAAERRAARIASAHSPAEWLWYIRRTPESFAFNDIPTTGPYSRTLAEAITQLSLAPPPRLPRGAPTWTADLSRAAVRDIQRLVAVTAVLYQIHGTMRWAAKGANVRFFRDELPNAEPDEGLEAAVFSYDDRIGKSESNPLARAGLHELLQMEDLESAVRNSVPIIGLLPTEEPIPLPLREPTGFTHVRGRFGLRLFDLGQANLITDERLPPDLRIPPGLAELIVFLWAGVHGAMLRQGGMPTVISAGYRVAALDDFRDDLERSSLIIGDGLLGGLIPAERAPKSASDVLKVIARLSPELWPPCSGRPIREIGSQHILVDLQGATLQLFRHLSRPASLSGSLVNGWSAHFEPHLQRIVDSSPWRPPPGIAKLARRDLRIGGRTITDVDAIGALRGTLLLIDGRSRPFSDQYNRGDRQAVRSAEADAIGKHASWQRKVAGFRSQPTGDNYDFSGYQNIVGVVAYPFLPFISEGPATADVLPGLPAVVSSAELSSFLRQG